MENKKIEGVLYLCATPIGNLEDITLRVLKVLREEVDLIAAEDTRHTLKLLNYFSIKKKLLSYHEHNKAEVTEYFIKLLLEGKKIALVSDAGMPAIADPGELLVKRAIEEKIKIVPLPGANAALTALIVSGMKTIPSVIVGFLPKSQNKQLALLDTLKTLPYTLVFYETPHRLLKTLQQLLRCLGNREIVLARELTKFYEEIYYFDLLKMIEYCEGKVVKGEIVLVIEGNKEVSEKKTENESNVVIKVKQEIEQFIFQGMKKNEAIKIIAKKYSLERQKVYKLFL